MENVLVSDVMARNPVTVRPETSILECAKKMFKKKVGSLIISDKKRFLGVISNIDILWALTKKPGADFSKIDGRSISQKKIATIKPSATINEAINKMKRVKFFRIPVVKNGEVLGIITMRDILSFHPELYKELGEIEQIKEDMKRIASIGKEENEVVKDGICEECGDRGVLYRRGSGELVCNSCFEST
ncbi:MAG: CBS domain-containing protein [Candidatus Pacearchaeota archaeon]